MRVVVPFQNCPMFPCSHTFSLFAPLLINLLTTYKHPQFPPAKKKKEKRRQKLIKEERRSICVTHHLKHSSEIHNPSEWDEH